MGLLDNVLSNFGYIRYSNGDNFYRMLKGSANFLNGRDKLDIALSNPVLSSCINIRANCLSNAIFYQENANGEKVFDSKDLELVNNPNPFQSRQDFLKQYEWYRVAYGWVYQKPMGSVGFKPNSIYNLKSSCIEFPKELKRSLIWDKQDTKDYYSQEFIYEQDGIKKKIELKDIIPFYDISNGLIDTKESLVTSPSRLDSIIKSLSNIDLALTAENVMIQSNGRELFSQDVKGGNLGVQLPMDVEDKNNIDAKLVNNFGFGRGRRRAITTNKPVEWQSLHIKLSELGLHESITNNANIVSQSLEVPNEIYKAFKKGDTFENQGAAMVNFYQNVIQPVADDLCNSWNSFFDIKNPIKASFEHIPSMSTIEEQKANRMLKIATAYEKLTRAGFNLEQVDELLTSNGINSNED